ncbi:alpha-L-fucosidase [Tamlana fucoidanivorans]|uniref:alpha-L-fucosidase n=1 Tax=Allotamlana fucoidanivorans TaxID=2583814 RepID=A0A5C4SQI8_9FLAO|nr:alpha-L-fucosidase [Tamlana fucoidanivorans]TNJ46055.1 alpha-L-fucosidase [Tamlana fucoidanivorans]
MKKIALYISLILVFACGKKHNINKKDDTFHQFESNWESLSKQNIPEWFKDAKFGIYAHLGVYCVPAFENEWYPRKMYSYEKEKYQKVKDYHRKTYGPIKDFGYKDFIPLFKCENFDAEEWAELYKKAGAKFAGPVAEHHDGFSMWGSKVNRWNAVDMGPKRDIAGELVKAIRKRDMKVVTSFHHSYNVSGFFVKQDSLDTGDPEYADLYGQEGSKIAYENWFLKMKEVIDEFKPDQLWFDFKLKNIPDEYKIRMAQYYYNKEAEWKKDVIITRKNDDLPSGVGVLDVERSKQANSSDRLWQTDDALARYTWIWVPDIELKPERELIHELIDIVSKNGVLLLNACPKADGTIPDDQKKILYAIGDFLKINGQGIYKTRPWKIHGEGPNLYDKGRGMDEYEKKPVEFTGNDIRFTSSKDGKIVYVHTLGWPKDKLIIESMGLNSKYLKEKIKSVSMLGNNAKTNWNQTQNGLEIDVSNTKPRGNHAYTWAVQL